MRKGGYAVNLWYNWNVGIIPMWINLCEYSIYI